MKNVIQFLGIFILCLSISIGAEAQKKKKGSKKSSKKEVVLTERDRMNLTYNFYNAQLEKQKENYVEAAEYFTQCLKIDPKNDASMYELALIYSGMKDLNNALNFSKGAYGINPKNKWYATLLAELYQRTNNTDKAIEIYEDLTKHYPNDPEHQLSLATALTYSGDYEDAIEAYNKVEKIYGPSPELTEEKKRLYLKLDRVDDAANELNKLIEHFPDEYSIYSSLIDLYQVNNMPEKALETIKQLENAAGDSYELSLALSEYYRSTGENDESFDELKKAFTYPEMSSNTKMRVLTSYLPLVRDDKKMLNQALQLSESFTKSDPQNALAHAIYADYLNINEETEKARDEYRKAIKIDKSNLNVWQQLLFTESTLSDFKSLEKESGEALELFPNQPIFYLLNGIAKSRNNKHEDAIKSLKVGSKMVVDNQIMLVDFYSNMGEAYNELENYEESDAIFDKALRIDPNNSLILNNYSYFLSLREQKLDKAEAMSKKSNALSPNNVSYLDTYGWIMYKMKRYEDAEVWLKKALDNGGSTSDVILEHYGDALFQMGNKQEAIEYWKKAKENGEGSEFLDKKLQNNSLFE
ncbi:MAG: tetratricopeptide repeat protein [Bacteroidia bacterium]|nr:tetratricopeptide repeat protein [Bacteroidia bacterium]NNC84802.1 tetratricopeptide repeat protein [Bacteroidia bacterium]NNM15281.1 tetratricopeptide repeat protein [Bacteroidia bacterium]